MIGRDLVQQAFPNQPRMQAAFAALVADAEDATDRLNKAIAAIGTLADGAEGIVAQLAQKQPKNDTLSAVAQLPIDPGVIEQIQPGIIAIRAIDTADTASLVTRALGDSRWLGGAHGAASAAKLTTARSISITGDMTWSVTFDGLANVSAAGTLATVNATTGSFGSATQSLTITTNAKGLITNIAAQTITPAFSSVTGKPTTLAGYGITDAQGSNANLTAISGLTTAADKLSYWTGSGTAALISFPAAARTALATLTGTNTGDQTITLTGDATGSGTGSFAVTVGKINGVALSSLATGILKNTTTTGVPSIAVAADFPTLNQNTTGSAASLTTGRTIAITGDLAWTSPSFDGSGNVTAAGTLATVNTNTGSWGSATQVAQITLDGKGRATAAANVTITPAVGSITGLGTGVATALAVNVGSAGAFVTFNGALGTPSSGTLTNCTFPTLNQNTTGSAAKLTTARTIAGNSFDGTANISINDTDLSGAAWASWTPTWTNVTLGNGTVDAKYKQVGKTVVARMALTLGSTTVISGNVGFSFPVTRATYGGPISTPLGIVRLWDASAATTVEGMVSSTSTTNAAPISLTVVGGFVVGGNVNATAPFTWATGDGILAQFVFEVA